MRYVKLIPGGLLLLALSFTSCECRKEKGPEISTFPAPPGGFQVARKKPTLRVAAVTPSPVAAPVEEREEEEVERPEGVPEDFPADVPIFKDATLSQVQDLANQAHNVIFTTYAPVPEVASFYEDKMRTAGWRVTQQFQRGEHAFISFQKGDLIMNLTVAEDARYPGQQVIAIMYEEQQPLPFEEF